MKKIEKLLKSGEITSSLNVEKRHLLNKFVFEKNKRSFQISRQEKMPEVEKENAEECLTKTFNKIKYKDFKIVNKSAKQSGNRENFSPKLAAVQANI